MRRKELELARRQKALEEILPHLYVPMYNWQREFHESTNRVNLLTASNQSGKSSALIRRCIANATDPSRWEKMWGKGVVPRQMWYFYPDGLTLEREVATKWVPEWLPRGRMERDAQFGWRITTRSSKPAALTFNSGPTVYFQTYTKNAANIQASSVHEVFVDEELPMNFYDEIMFRLTVTSGIFNSGFTPTLNQEFWRQAMNTNKVLPLAHKRTVSMYDCLTYEDGSPSRIMTLEKIHEAESKCKNETERQRRIFGRFVTETGRSFFAFEFEKNVKPKYDIKGWHIYAGVDYGSGYDQTGSPTQKNAKNHPSAIVFIAVRPDHKKGAVFRAWRGDYEKTTAGDTFNKYKELSKDLLVVQACYDPAAADFGIIAERNSTSFVKAKKTRDSGEDLVNTLFGHELLDIFDDDPETLKLAGELTQLMIANQAKSGKRDDDLSDALRYACMLIPWDLSEISAKFQEEESPVKAGPMTEAELVAEQIRQRRGDVPSGKDEGSTWEELENEFKYWNSEYG